MKSIMSKFAGALGLLAMLAVAALAVAVFSGAYHLTPVLSGSMRPAFDAGAVVVTERVDSDEVAIGDVIVFFAPGDDQKTVHRVIEATQDAEGTVVRTRGDANNIDDPWRARLTDDTYRVVADVPWVGHASIALRSNVTVLIYGLAAVCVLAALRSFGISTSLRSRRLPTQ